MASSMPGPGEPQILHNETSNRFECEVGGIAAYARYRREGNKLILTHTEVPAEFRDQGVGAQLARVALDFARAERLRVVPLCPFVASFIRRTPEYQDLLDHGE